MTTYDLMHFLTDVAAQTDALLQGVVQLGATITYDGSFLDSGYVVRPETESIYEVNADNDDYDELVLGAVLEYAIDAYLYNRHNSSAVVLWLNEWKLYVHRGIIVDDK
jgi:DNA-binding transcriptional regulator WhiA